MNNIGNSLVSINSIDYPALNQAAQSGDVASTLPIWALVLIVASLVAFILLLIDFFKKLYKNILSAPGKGFSKITNYFSNRKAIKKQVKLDKALMVADTEARLNAARKNPNYGNHPKVRVILAKKELKDVKKRIKQDKKR